MNNRQRKKFKIRKCGYKKWNSNYQRWVNDKIDKYCNCVCGEVNTERVLYSGIDYMRARREIEMSYARMMTKVMAAMLDGGTKDGDKEGKIT